MQFRPFRESEPIVGPGRIPQEIPADYWRLGFSVKPMLFAFQNGQSSHYVVSAGMVTIPYSRKTPSRTTNMSSQRAAGAAYRWTAFEQLSLAREVMQTESRTIAQVARRLDEEFCRAVDYLYQLPRQRDRHGHRQGGARRPEDHGHPGLHRHAEPLPPSGRSGARRPGPRASRRRCAGALAERRDRGDRPPPALVGRGRRADHRHHRRGGQHAGPRRQPRSSTWDRWKRRVRWGWRRAAARRPCWRWATPWPWSSAA